MAPLAWGGGERVLSWLKKLLLFVPPAAGVGGLATPFSVAFIPLVEHAAALQ